MENISDLDKRSEENDSEVTLGSSKTAEEALEKIEKKEAVEGAESGAEAAENEERKKVIEAREEEDEEKIIDIREELAEDQSKKEEQIAIQEALESVIDKIQEKKIEIEERIKEETHFRKAFPWLSFFGSWGRSMAHSNYGEEYKKVEAKEAGDENTLERLNTREIDAQAQIKMLKEGKDPTMSLESAEDILEQMEKLEQEENKAEKKEAEEKKASPDETRDFMLGNKRVEWASSAEIVKDMKEIEKKRSEAKKGKIEPSSNKQKAA